LPIGDVFRTQIPSSYSKYNIGSSGKFELKFSIRCFPAMFNRCDWFKLFITHNKIASANGEIACYHFSRLHVDLSCSYYTVYTFHVTADYMVYLILQKVIFISPLPPPQLRFFLFISDYRECLLQTVSESSCLTPIKSKEIKKIDT